MLLERPLCPVAQRVRDGQNRSETVLSHGFISFISVIQGRCHSCALEGYNPVTGYNIFYICVLCELFESKGYVVFLKQSSQFSLKIFHQRDERRKSVYLHPDLLLTCYHICFFLQPFCCILTSLIFQTVYHFLQIHLEVVGMAF